MSKLAISRAVARTVATLMLTMVSTAITRAAVHTFPHPDRIRYDSQCLTIDGHDTFVYSGAFHYFRCPQPLWSARFEKIKAAGFNTVETYIPWNLVEPEEPVNPEDFSKIDPQQLKQVDDFLTMAESYGLNVIIRPGPYICAEWNRGALPAWLLRKRPADLPPTKPWFRTDDPAFIAWSKHWYHAVCPTIARHQVTRKPAGQPGVILFQLENEYDYSKLPDDMRTRYVASLSDDAAADGIDVPMFTCWTSIARDSKNASVNRAFDSCNFYVEWNVSNAAGDLQKVHRQQPDAPVMVTELQGGWFTAPQDPMPIRPDQDYYRADIGPSQVQNLELFAIQNGATLTNYYMLFGGTNLGFSDAGIDITTCYDYTAAIRECGGVGAKYQAVRGVGQFLAEHGANLVRAQQIDCHASTNHSDVTVVERRAADGSQYFFVRNTGHEQARKGIAHVQPEGAATPLAIDYDLERFGSKVLYLAPGQTDVAQGVWYPKAQEPIARPDASDVAKPVEIHDVVGRDDTDPTQFAPVNGKGAVALGIDGRQLVYYNATTPLPSSQNTNYGLALLADVAATDNVAVRVNGSVVGQMDKGRIDLGPALHDGQNQIELIYDNGGYNNFDSSMKPLDKMERLGGITGLHLIRTPKGGSANSGSVTAWKMHTLDPATTFGVVPAGFQPDTVNALPELQPDYDDSQWSTAPDTSGHATQLPAGQTAAFRGTLQVSQDDLSNGRTTLAVSSMDDRGWVYVNGQLVGKGTNWDEKYAFDASKALKPGQNSIVVVVRNDSGDGGVGDVRLIMPDQPVADLGSTLGFSDHSAGIDGHWMETTDSGGWTKATLPETGNGTDPAVAWRRLTFELPTSPSGTWVPWLLRLNATGNATISLNGHPIGRYYHKTPQTDYFLPDCWLNTGTGKTNVVTLQLNRANTPIAVQSATVLPYSAYAEKR